MALTGFMLDRLLPELKQGQAIASMGYPDIVAEDLKLPGVPKYRDDFERICRRHNQKPHPVPDSESLFELYGVSLDVYDVVEERGCEVLVDLNYPLPAEACEQYEYVLDVGTLEHCFNVAQALVNMACLLKVGGLVFHENPFNWGNHGFYNLNPTLFHDFYTDNGFEIVESLLLPKGGEPIKAPHTKRFKYGGPEANLFTLARRKEVVPISFPVQTKYRDKIN